MVEENIDQLIEEKQYTYNQLQQQNEQLKKEILVKDLEIEQLRTREKLIKEHVEELSEKCEGRKERRKTTENKTAAETFRLTFEEAFGSMTIEEVKHKLEVSVSKCL